MPVGSLSSLCKKTEILLSVVVGSMVWDFLCIDCVCISVCTDGSLPIVMLLWVCYVLVIIS